MAPHRAVSARSVRHQQAASISSSSMRRNAACICLTTAESSSASVNTSLSDSSPTAASAESPATSRRCSRPSALNLVRPPMCERRGARDDRVRVERLHIASSVPYGNLSSTDHIRRRTTNPLDDPIGHQDQYQGLIDLSGRPAACLAHDSDGQASAGGDRRRQ
jgi:hypothetical protein